MIQVKNVVKHYGDVQAVRGVNFTVSEGEIFGFLGPNGAGKTTTIKMMIGLLKPTSGEITVNGKDVIQDAKAIHQDIGVVFDEPNFYERMSVEENLYFYGSLHDVGKDRVDELIHEFQLDEKRKAKFKKLSKGQKQRVTIIRAILHRPKILFLDEPTSGLDPTSAEIIRNQVRELKKQGTTIVLTTHYMEEADQLCDHLAFINQGQIVAEGAPHELKLAHGQRKIEIQYKVEDQIREEEFKMDELSSADRIHQIMRENELLTIHSREATLAEVFIQLTGRDILL